TAASVMDPTRQAVADIDVVASYDFLVTSANDVSDGTCNFSHCSLREAIIAANAVTPAPTAPLTIGFASSLANATITLTAALPTPSRAVSIVGPGAGLLTIDADGSSANPRRVITVAINAPVSISGMTLTGGHIASGDGGAIRVNVAGELQLADVRINSSFAAGGGGGLYADNSSDLVMTDVEFAGNTAGTVGGGLVLRAATAELTNVNALDNTTGLGGGGLHLEAGSVIDISGGVISGNRTTSGSGGGLSVTAGAVVNLDNVEVHSNKAIGTGGR